MATTPLIILYVFYLNMYIMMLIGEPLIPLPQKTAHILHVNVYPVLKKSPKSF